MIPHWPVVMPQYPKREAFSGGPLDTRARFSTEYGPPILRARTTADPEVYDATFRNLRLAQLTAFRTFYRDTLNRGAKSYSWRDPVYGDAALWKILGDGEKAYNVIARGADLHDLSLKLMRMPGTPWWAPYVQAGSSQVPYVVADYANGVYGVSGQKVVASDLAAVTGTFDVLTLDFADVETIQAGRVLTGAPRTNHVLWSENFNNAVWTKTNIAITPDAVVAPDGSLTADQLVENTATAVHLVSQTLGFTPSDNATVTLSVYVKAVGRDFFWLETRTKAVTFPNAYFNLATGVVAATFNGASATITPVGDGWYRCTLTANVLTGAGTPQFTCGPGVAANSAGRTYLGDGSSGVYLWGAQYEVGAAPTYYIQTGAAAASQPDGIPAEQPPGIKRISGFVA